MVCGIFSWYVFTNNSLGANVNGAWIKTVIMVSNYNNGLIFQSMTSEWIEAHFECKDIDNFIITTKIIIIIIFSNRYAEQRMCLCLMHWCDVRGRSRFNVFVWLELAANVKRSSTCICAKGHLDSLKSSNKMQWQVIGQRGSERERKRDREGGRGASEKGDSDAIELTNASATMHVVASFCMWIWVECLCMAPVPVYISI